MKRKLLLLCELCVGPCRVLSISLTHTNHYVPFSRRTYPVNDGAANMGGSYIAGIDYDRDMMARFMNHGGPASNMVVGYDSMIKKAYNLRGEPLGPRMEGNTTVGAHLSNTDADGQWAVASLPRIEYDWFYQSLCSAHLEETHQWGPGIGVEDDLFITNEEWHTFNNVTNFVGNSVRIVRRASVCVISEPHCASHIPPLCFSFV